MTIWGGSGSSDPCFWLMDPDPAIFVIDLQDDSKKLLFKFFCLFLFECIFTSFVKDKCQKETQNRRNLNCSYYFCMMIEGSGYIPLTSGSGSRRPTNMWIRNNALQYFDLCLTVFWPEYQAAFVWQIYFVSRFGSEFWDRPFKLFSATEMIRNFLPYPEP
jgi:hypothetical protein